MYIYSTNTLGGKKKVIPGGVRCSKWTPINLSIYLYIYIYKRPTPSFINKEDQRKRGKKQRSWHWTNIWPWVPAGPDARCECAGWLPAVSFCFCFFEEFSRTRPEVVVQGSSTVDMLTLRVLELFVCHRYSNLESVIKSCSYDVWNYPKNWVTKSGTHYLLLCYLVTCDNWC
jgi:hypothetical protein